MNRRKLMTSAAGVALGEILRARSARAQGSVYDAIASAAANYGISYDWLVSTASCETGGTMNPGAYNPATGDHGLFQFKMSTFYAYCSGDPYNPYDAANCAAKMFSMGLCGAWCCSGCHPNPCDSLSFSGDETHGTMRGIVEAVRERERRGELVPVDYGSEKTYEFRLLSTSRES